MSFPKYPTYKDSGVEWLGEVPEHWAIFSLKRAVDGCANGLWGEEPDGENDIAVIRVADFDRGISRVGLDKLTYRSITQKERASRLLQPGDLLIEKSGGGEKTLVGCVVLFEHDFQAITSNFVARMRPLVEFDNRFLCYAFDSLYQGKVNYPAIKQTTGIQNLDSEAYLQERFCFPPRAEQTKIARFLDHETARIDALIEEQQRLIELLKEKRQAVISHAVTKGLDPSVPMKDSGVEWLGEVPAHWEVTRIGWQCLVGNGCTPSRDNQNYWNGGHFPWLNSSKVNLGRVVNSDQFVTDSALKECALPIVKPGCVLMAITGEGKTRGMVTITEIEATISQHIAFMEPRSCALISSYLHDWLSANYERVRHDSADWGSTKAAITCADIRAYPLPLPPIDEQNKICQFIEEKSSLFDDLTLAADENVNLLQERRSALISAAVTGKIDLRGWQPPTSAPAPIREQETV
ncbi:restriction endonuclease subunit S [Pseudomonas sp. AN-1]|uniref:restriction endonuclease subunit S n=1 Tax=Pseudomonas sp. AN-1 TaxID=3096605 RepID=UPI002A69AFDE|nr:restriction endonuclease subunit S [Pseudomonas sp. AN-1]WPP46071.1 restriction endonuclease subunit S [Pseudomonas sp. AN-1]